MIKFLVFLLAIYLTSAGNTTEQDCAKLSGPDCGTCVRLNGCAYCPKNKKCFLQEVSLNDPCGNGEQRIYTCIGNLKIWIIIVSVVGGIILLSLLITVCCICRKFKRCRLRKEERRQRRQDQQMTERQAAADARTTDRNRLADQLRMKYGILKEREGANDYSRMN